MDDDVHFLCFVLEVAFFWEIFKVALSFCLCSLICYAWVFFGKFIEIPENTSALKAFFFLKKYLIK